MVDIVPNRVIWSRLELFAEILEETRVKPGGLAICLSLGKEFVQHLLLVLDLRCKGGSGRLET